MDLRKLVGSGDRIMVVTLPVVVVGLALNLANPALFRVGGPPTWLLALSIVVLLAGLVMWAWSAALILRDVPRGRLITGGPFALVKHPLYTGVALFVVPWAGFLLDTWLGVVIGAVMYVAMRAFAPAEEAELSRTFGAAWRDYAARVRLQWL
jgi:protein-S-isoprenylcysteine O-methyltransferase Ste14